jgi:Fe-S cluster assembly iron-binding protein IscA
VVDISETASMELGKVLHDDTHKGKQLFVSFMGFGCSGPVLGLALDEPDETCSAYESNGISVYMHPALIEHLEPLGGVIIDFIDNGPDQRGFTISTRIKPESSCGGSCSSHGCGDSETHQ